MITQLILSYPHWKKIIVSELDADRLLSYLLNTEADSETEH